MGLLVFGIALPWALVAIGCWIGFQLIRQGGRILERLEALEKLQRIPLQLAPLPPMAVPQPVQQPAQQAMPAGLPGGAAAPQFTLSDLAGRQRSLSEWRGKSLLLIFFDPLCGFCAEIAPDLAGLPADSLLLVSTGDAEANRRFFAEQFIKAPVLLQSQMSVASTYGVHGTPIGYFIDGDGNIASPMTSGGPSLLALAEAMKEAMGDQAGHGKVHKGNRDLSTSRLNRDGLTAGTVAPPFTLPRLDGGELSLADFRGQRVLLVFSDPHCGPCMQAAPELERLSHTRPDIQVIMISKGDLEENRAKVREFGLTFPMVMQKRWEISTLYAMFATPIGYLIGEDGVLLSDVAIGSEQIIALLTAPRESFPGKDHHGTLV